MFYYFGRKWKLAKEYPTPKYPLIIEPFAGSMGFSLYHKPERALGIEADPNVFEMWDRITKLTVEEILNYPEPAVGDRVFDRWLLMASISHGTADTESWKWTPRMTRNLKSQKNFAAKNLGYVQEHVEYRLDTYLNAPDIEATWFIDPPYQMKIKGYKRIGLDYKELADFVMSRKGQIIVCEQLGADWLPFNELIEIKGTNNKKTMEVLWYRET